MSSFWLASYLHIYIPDARCRCCTLHVTRDLAVCMCMYIDRPYIYTEAYARFKMPETAYKRT
jgi:hypothetical protein